VADGDKRQVPRSRNLIHFTISGPADLVGVENGDSTDLQSFQIPQVHAFNGLAMAIIRTRANQSGVVRLHAESDGLVPADVSVSVQ
jgi:beta-galactosidase